MFYYYSYSKPQAPEERCHVLYENKTSVACLVGPGLNNIFHLYAHWLISYKYLFGPISDFLLLIAFEKIDVS